MASCPYTKSPEWIALSEKFGEFQAYAVFIENNYSIPADLNDVVPQPIKDWTQEKHKNVKSIKDATKLRTEMLNGLVTRINAFEDNTEYYAELRDTIEKFTKADIEKGIDDFISNGIGAVKGAINRISAMDDPSLEQLKQVNDFVGLFSMIDDLIKIISTSPLFVGPDYKTLRANVSTLKGDITKFNAIYINQAKPYLAGVLAKSSTRMRFEKKEALASEFRSQNPPSKWKGSKEGYTAAKLAFIKRGLAEAVDEIAADELQHVTKLLDAYPDDISKLTERIVDARNINDPIIQGVVAIIENAEHRVNQTYIRDQRDAISTWEKWVNKNKAKGVAITDQKKLYNGIIEIVDGKETQYYVHPLYSAYRKSRAEYESEIARLLMVEGGEEAALDLEKTWKEEHLIDPEKAVRNWNIKKEFHNPQFDALQGDQKEMYDYLIAFNKESDDLITGAGKLGYRIPGMDKTTSERLVDNGKWEAVKRVTKEAISITESDAADYGVLDKNSDGTLSLMSDASGRPLQRVNLPYRTRPNIEDQSYDLMGMALTNRYASINYKEKMLIKTDIEVLRDVIAERDVTVVRGGKRVLVKARNFFNITNEEEAELEATIKGEDTNMYKALTTIIDSRLYGRHAIPAIVGNISIDKITNKLIKFSADNMLIANALGAQANALNGHTMNFLEATKYNHYGLKNLSHAQAKYLAPSNLVGIINDIESLQPKNRTNLFFDKFLDTSTNFNPAVNKLVNDSRFKRLLNTSTLHGANTTAEHYIQGVLMYAVMDNVKVMQGDMYVAKDGSLTTDRAQAMSMDQGYVAQDNGLLEWGNKEWTAEGYDVFDDNTEAAIRRKVKDITADLQGQYDANMKSAIEREWFGKLAFFLRKWMVRGAMTRWREVAHVGTATKDLQSHQRFYSEAQGMIKEGTYTTLIRYMISVGKKIRSQQAAAFSTNWNELSDYERGNIKGSLAEISMMIATLIASKLLASLADDDDDEIYRYAYLLRRVYSELMFFTPLSPFEAAQFLRTPSATLSTLELQFRLWTQLMKDVGGMEYYERGIHEGNSKSGVLFNKAFNPIYKNWYARGVPGAKKKSYDFLNSGMNY